jgi:hypothetical protein
MHHVSIAIALATLSIGGLAQATPFEPATIPQHAEAAGHLDADALRTTQLFAALGGQSAFDSSIGKLPDELRPLAAPLLRTLRGVSFWHAGDHGALYVETRDGRMLAALLAKAPVKAGAPVDGIATYTADESAIPHNVHHHHDLAPVHHDHGFIGAYGDTLVLADSYDSLAQSLRVLAGRAPNLAGSRALTTRARSGVFVFVTLGDSLLGEVSKTSHSKLMQLGAKSIVIDVGENAGVVSANVHADLSTADALAKAKSIVEGMRAMASLSDEPGAKKMLDGVNVSTSGLALEITGRWAVADVKDLIEHAHEQHHK